MIVERERRRQEREQKERPQLRIELPVQTESVPDPKRGPREPIVIEF
jgi:hypothetical protein